MSTAEVLSNSCQAALAGYTIIVHHSYEFFQLLGRVSSMVAPQSNQTNMYTYWGSWRIFGDASITIAQWRRARDLTNLGYRRSLVRFRPKLLQLKSIWTWANRPSSKDSKLLFPVITTIKSKSRAVVSKSFPRCSKSFVFEVLTAYKLSHKIWV